MSLAAYEPLNTCRDWFLGDGGPFNGKEVLIELHAPDGGSITSGDYAIADQSMVAVHPSGSYAYLTLKLVANSSGTNIAYATSGSLSLTEINPLSGHFSAQMNNIADAGSLGQLDGDFNATVCTP